MNRRPRASVPADERIVIRGASGWWITGVLAALFVFMLADAALRAEWRTILLALPWMCVVLLICWWLLIRPCLVASPSTLSVVNVLRTHTLPWRTIADLQVRYQLIVTLNDGTIVRAWGSPTVHPRQDRESYRTQLPRSRRFVGVVEAIEQARDEVGRTANESTRATRTLAWWPFLGLAAAVASGFATAGLLL